MAGGLTAEQASKLTSGGQPVVLETLAGSTTGTVGGVVQALSAQAGQERLTAQ